MQHRKYTDIFLDFDDTLYDTHGNACLALEVVYSHFRLDRYFGHIDDFTVPYWQTNEQLWAQYAQGEIDRPTLILERFRRPLSLGRTKDGECFCPTVEFCHEVSDFFLDCCCEQTGVIEGAHELLRGLKARGYRLHMTSNGFHEVQYRKLDRVAMTGYFDTVILSEDAGHNKPSREYFDYALRMSGAQTATTVMVGDNLTSDIMGARAAGIDQIWFNPDGKPIPDLTTDNSATSLRVATTLAAVQQMLCE